MLHIKKKKAPSELDKAVRELRDTPGAAVNYGSLRADVTRAIRESLCEEQGGLCAYCMRRITPDNMTIEHYVAQHGDDPEKERLSVKYGNMLGVCKGIYGHGRKAQTCDKHRGNRAFRVLNPLKKDTLQSLRYRSDGLIQSNDEDVKHDIALLNLNSSATPLPENRRKAIEALHNKLLRDLEGKSDKGKVAYCERMKKGLLEKLPYYEYLGALLFVLDKQIKKHSSF